MKTVSKHGERHGAYKEHLRNVEKDVSFFSVKNTNTSNLNGFQSICRNLAVMSEYVHSIYVASSSFSYKNLFSTSIKNKITIHPILRHRNTDSEFLYESIAYIQNMYTVRSY